jgi:diacylglycerol kinase family enzyme
MVSGLRHLRDEPFQIEMRLDGGPVMRMPARMVLVANIGKVHARLDMLPGADPTDGLLDIAVICPKGTRDWMHIAYRVIRGLGPDGRHLHGWQARHVQVQADRAQPYEVDGEVLGETSGFSIGVRPGAVLVHTPAGGAPDAAPIGGNHTRPDDGSGGETGAVLPMRRSGAA